MYLGMLACWHVVILVLLFTGDSERHVGDLGNIVANESGVAEGAMKDAFIQL